MDTFKLFLATLSISVGLSIECNASDDQKYLGEFFENTVYSVSESCLDSEANILPRIIRYVFNAPVEEKDLISQQTREIQKLVKEEGERVSYQGIHDILDRSSKNYMQIVKNLKRIRESRLALINKHTNVVVRSIQFPGGESDAGRKKVFLALGKRYLKKKGFYEVYSDQELLLLKKFAPAESPINKVRLSRWSEGLASPMFQQLRGINHLNLSIPGDLLDMPSVLLSFFKDMINLEYLYLSERTLMIDVDEYLNLPLKMLRIEDCKYESKFLERLLKDTSKTNIQEDNANCP